MSERNKDMVTPTLDNMGFYFEPEANFLKGEGRSRCILLSKSFPLRKIFN